MQRFWLLTVAVVFGGSLDSATPLVAADPVFRAGAVAVDVTPERFPVAVNCGFVEQPGKLALDKLHARALVLDDGKIQIALVVVDNCMMPREFLDKTKELIAEELKIPTNRQMISATHTHTAPAVMGCLGSDPDPAYGEFLQRQIVRAVRLAIANLTPAKAGWAVASAEGYTNNRQWILRSDKVRSDPFGNPTVRSNMHPGYQNPDFVGPSGPVDPWLSLLAVQSLEGKPLAVLANFSMHYFGSAPVSADYFGKFCGKFEQRVGSAGASPFVTMLSQGTAGDLHWMDYGKPKTDQNIEKYAEAVTDVAFKAWKTVQYRSDITLAMAEAKLALDRRVPDAARLEWARKRMEPLAGKKPTTQPDIYAREAIFLHEEPKRELKIQAIRIGDLGITTMPNEVFALTGLKVKARSPLAPTFTIELANGADGYIPPPEQHVLGGYTTWPARTAGLGVLSEPRILDTALGLLEKVSGKKRHFDPDPTADPYAKTVLADSPVAYWRLGDLAGPKAANAIGGASGNYEPGVVFGLDGPVPRLFEGHAAVNRAAHFAGGRLTGRVPELGSKYSVELWFWNGFPLGVREDLGVVMALGIPRQGTKGPQITDMVYLDGKGAEAPFRTWTHLLYVRDRNRSVLYLNGKEIRESKQTEQLTEKPSTIWIGGSPDGKRFFEGRIAEVAVYDRMLTATEAKARVNAVTPDGGKP